MTVQLSHRSFKRMLFRWKGSIWKALWKELVVFLCLYTAINAMYRVAMTPDQKLIFETIVHFVGSWADYIPLQFLLGFFVSYIMGRWWDQLTGVPWPDQFLYLLSFNFNDMDEESRMIRRTIARWCNLHMILCWREICIKVKKRFPKDHHLMETGLMTEEEFDMYENTSRVHGRWFVPIMWIGNMLHDLHKHGKLSDHGFEVLSQAVYKIRAGNGTLCFYDWINTPLRYIQITTFATYAYFFVAMLGRQGIKKTHEGNQVDIYFPLITVLEFIFYIGWLKVAEENRVPFGEEDDDLDMNYIVDRNLYVSYMIVDELCAQHPPATKDKYFESRSAMVQHTRASYMVRDRIPHWRLHHFKVPESATPLLPEFNHYAEPPPIPAEESKLWFPKGVFSLS